MKKTNIPSAIVMLSGKSGLTILFLVLLGGFVWSFMAYRDAKKEISFISSPEGRAQVAQLEIDVLLAKVGGLILLPEGEKPAVATIQDIEALVESEAFYKGAKNGDKVIVYRQKAIIYDPVNNKLVNVGPVYLQNEPVSPVAEPVQEEVEEVFEPAAVIEEVVIDNPEAVSEGVVGASGEEEAAEVDDKEQ